MVIRAHREDESNVVIFCPGCREAHVFDKRWTFNGNFELPTFRASFLTRSGHYVTGQSKEECNICQREKPSICRICHSFVTDGRIEFLGDSSHALAGSTHMLPQWSGFDPANYLW